MPRVPAVKVLCETQGTQEWHDVKRGKLSASCAHFALARQGGRGRSNYVETLADAIEDIPNFDEEDDPPWFAEGRYYESWARGWYSWNQGVVVKETGFIIHDDYSWLGCSPDGLVGEEGMVEIKYRKFLHTFYDHSSIGANAAVIAQVQTQMFVCGKRWNDYVNYWRSDEHEKEKGSIKRIERDDAYIDNILLPGFVGLWSEVQELLTSRKQRYTT
jgi:hypothetical protein